MPNFKTKLRQILRERKIPIQEFCWDTGINRENFFYRKKNSGHPRHVYMAIAYYLGVKVEDLIDGTDAELYWYGDYGI